MNHYRKVLFPTYIYHYNLKGHNKVLKDILVPKIEQYLKDYPAPDKSPPGWISSNIITSWGRNTINQKLFAQSAEVNKCYKEHFMKIFGMTVKSSVKFTDAWFNYYIDGQYQEPHDHINPDYNTPDPHFSAIHFLQFDKNIHQPVKEGDIIVFPCHLTHFVNASEPTPEYPRISVAFNINIQEEI